MSETPRFPAQRDIQANQTLSRRAYLFESLAIVLLAALAAYAAS